MKLYPETAQIDQTGLAGQFDFRVIRFLSEVDGFVPWKWWPHDEVGHTDESKKEITNCLGRWTLLKEIENKTLCSVVSTAGSTTSSNVEDLRCEDSA